MPVEISGADARPARSSAFALYSRFSWALSALTLLLSTPFSPSWPSKAVGYHGVAGRLACLDDGL